MGGARFPKTRLDQSRSRVDRGFDRHWFVAAPDLSRSPCRRRSDRIALGLPKGEGGFGVAIGSRDGRGMRLGFIVPCILALLLAASPAEAAKRLALVIGNNAYENVPQLQKALNDADAIAQELSKLGFEVVKAEDVGRRAMSRALVELEGKIGPGDTALVYFAGHGFAIDGTNYLLPVDVPIAGPGEEGLVRDASFAASGLSDRLQQKGAATVILILDACRDNPFAIKVKRSLGITLCLSRR